MEISDYLKEGQKVSLFVNTESDDDIIYSLGKAEFIGNKIPHKDFYIGKWNLRELEIETPIFRILHSGELVFALQCWWINTKEFKKFISDRKWKKVDANFLDQYAKKFS